MTFFLTNTSKAKSILKNGGFDASQIAEMEKGKAKEYRLTEEQIKAIIRGDKNNVFETLNRACQLLKDSKLTRSTGHKAMDFSTIQATSNFNLAKYCYQQLPNVKIPDNSEEKITKEVSREIKLSVSKIWRNIYKYIKDAEGNTRIMQLLNQELAKPTAEKQKDFAEVVKVLQDDYGLDKNHIILPEVIDKSQKNVYKRIKGHAREAFYLGTRDFDLLNLSVKTITPETTPIGAMTRGGMSIGILLGCFTAALITHLVGPNITEARMKKSVIKLKEGLAKTIRDMNSLSKYIINNVKYSTGTNAKELEITTNHMELIKDFLKKQDEIWDPYTSDDGRGYHELIDKWEVAGDNTKNNKHWSLGKRVSNEKTSSIGKLKLGLANQWKQIKTPEN